jgi:putative FmdB family regulatory protein
VPLYEYCCNQCGHRFEKIQSFSAEPLTECPKCKGVLYRPLTAPAFQFKGSGWYVNDYAAKPAAASSSSSESTPPHSPHSPTPTATATADPPCATTGTCPPTGSAAPATTDK